MKKVLLLVVILLASCQNNDDHNTGQIPEPEPQKKVLVDKVYDYHDNLIAEYFYNDSNRLVKRKVNDPVSKTSSDYELEYENGRVSKIIYTDYSFPQFNHDIYIKYDDAGKIIRDETHQHGKMVGFNNYTYYEDGKIKGILGDRNKEYYILKYENTSNAVQSSLFVDDGDGSIQNDRSGLREIIRNFTYDNHYKPDFGLAGVFQIEPLPSFGTEAPFEKNTSKNNMTEFVGGTRWTYEYNEDGYPATIETKWKGIDTDDPLIIRLTYKPYK